MAERETGKVKWFNDQKGFGYVQPDDGGPELYVHYSQVSGPGYRSLQTGEAVEYTVDRQGGKPTAVDVVKLVDPTSDAAQHTHDPDENP